MCHAQIQREHLGAIYHVMSRQGRAILLLDHEPIDQCAL